MADSPLLKTQANQVLALIPPAGLDPGRFTWDTRNSGQTSSLKVSYLTYADSEFFYKFDFKGKLHYAKFSPGREVLVDEFYPKIWSNQLSGVKEWLRYLKREVEAPDLWAVAAQQGQFLSGSTGPAEDNSAFSSVERKKLADSLREIQEYMVSTQQLSTHQIGILGERLTYLEQASERVGRKDWHLLAVGTLINVATTIALTPDGAKDFLKFAATALGWLMHQPHLLP